jgi:hypothetical protein
LLWPGSTVAILASGPSMSAAVTAKVYAARIPSIAINDTYKLAPWASMLYAADESWWQRYPEASLFAGLKVSVGLHPGVLRLKNSGVTGFDSDPSCVRTGSNSGYQALHIAAHAGAKRVLLCGFDMRGDHWFGRHPSGLANSSEHLFTRFRRNFGLLAPELAVRGVSVVNCTPGSALTCFPMMELDEALAAVPV